MVSESFANDAATGTASYPTTGAPPTTAASAVTLSVRYDASAQSYTISTAGRAQTFGPANLDTTQSTAQVTVYTRQTAGVSESLTLTKPGSSGRFTYQYVAGGYWQRVVTNAATVDGSFDAFAYGVVTPGAAVPRTGTASYSVDLLGAESTSDNIVALSGAGVFEADFARGAFNVRGTMTGVTDAATIFSGEGHIASAGNGFSGLFRFRDKDLFSGDINGRFYGPDAQELGASWSTRSDTPFSPRVAVGTIIGRRDGALVANTSFAALPNDQFFGSDAASARGTYVSGAGGFTIAGSSARGAAVIVHYDATTHSYTLIDADRSKYFGADYPNGTSGVGIFSSTSDILTQFPTAGLSYVRSAEWLHRAPADNDHPANTFDHFAYGFETPAAAVPRSGKGGFVLTLNGAIMQPGEADYHSLRGSGNMLLDFAAGTLTINGGANVTQQNGSSIDKVGGFSGSGTLSTSANLFSGGINFSFAGGDTYAGNFNGRFYGPAAQEVGAAFSASAGNGGVLSGAFVGSRDDSLASSTKRLADYTDQTTFDTGYGGSFFADDLAPRASFVSPPGRLVPVLTWNPSAGTYSFAQSLDSTEPAFTASFAAADRVAAQSTDVFTVYRRTDGNIDSTVRIYNTGNGELSLTYTSFAQLRRVQTPRLTANNYFLPFGNPTPSASMPKSGSATYTGVIYGNGSRTTGGASTFYDLTGSSLLNVNFLNATVAAHLTIQGTQTGGTNRFDFGAFDMNGIVAGNVFSASDTSGQSQISGQFNGPAANEYGGVFAISGGDGTTRTVLGGVAVGKR